MEYIKKEDLIEGEIYYVSTTYGFWMIGLVTKSNNGDNSNGNFRGNATFINKRLEFNKDQSWCYKGDYRTYRLATPEEKRWLNEAIKLDKFITFEEAIKTFIPEYVECTREQYQSSYKVGIIYKLKNTLIENEIGGMAYWAFNQHRFKPSTKEAYDAQFVVKEPEFVLPEKWYIQRNSENFEVLNKWENDKRNGKVAFNPNNNCSMFSDKDYYYTKPEFILGYTEITFEQFKKYVLKEEIVEEKVIEPLPQFKIIESIETITKVENNEGNQFFIGDIVISDSGFVQTIKSFRYNVNKDNVLATTNICNQISIARLEHYIEPKVEETLLEKAKRLYPVGTKVNSLGGCENQIIDNNTPFMSGEDCVRFTMNCLVYLNGKWAEIIK